MQKSITLFISSLSGGGAEGVCVTVANGLAERGWQVDLVVLHLNHAVYRDRLSDQVNLINLNVSHARYAGGSLLKYLVRQKPKAIIVFNYELTVMTLVLKRFLRLKTLVIARNVSNLSQNSKQLKGIWQKHIVKPLIYHFYGKVDHVINQCQAMREDLMGLYPQLTNKSSVIYNPVAQHLSNYARTHDLTKVEKQDYLLCIGRLACEKAFHYAIEGFARIAHKFPTLRLKIVGQGPLEDSLKQVAKELGVADRVDFEGFQKNTIPYYIHAKATLLTSLYEGFPNVLVESISLGTPVVSFDSPSGPSEVIEEGVNGYLVAYQDVSDLENKLLKLLDREWPAEVVASTAQKNQIDEVSRQYEKVITYVLNQER